MTIIGRLLIANRGEIACRVMRTAQALGIETVAVYSDADRDALHVRTADLAIRLGPAPAVESYLAIDRIIEAARQTRSDAIHPGYGFLSENASFARACREAGIVLVGPSEHAIALMGDKAKAKRAMLEAGVPCVPGYQGDDQSDETLIGEAELIGFPLMIKAAAGGGGRGMRLIDDASELANGIAAARSEAAAAFGADELILEKAIDRPRHVEVQVFGDEHGTIVHLGERDCSVQRRHQKVIEEAPCPVMTPELRAAMGEAAVTAARAVDYVGAGTVEFLLAQDESFYFLEMNTRLQVEHPVTELVTGLDLVELQVKVASGHPLELSQEEVRVAGHAIEARLYAEDPGADFLPSSGRIERWLPPRGPGIRLDTGIETGSEVSTFYDPMLAKVISGGATREEARRRLVRALSASALAGPATNRDFLIDALTRDTFAAGHATTAFIEEEYGAGGFDDSPTLHDLCLAAVIQHELGRSSALSESLGVSPELLNWSSGAELQTVYGYERDGGVVEVTVRVSGPKSYLVTAEGADGIELELLTLDDQTATLRCGDERHRLAHHANVGGRSLTLSTETRQFTVWDVTTGDGAADGAGSGMIASPMHGQLLEVFVRAGDAVVTGQRLALLEAMKMQHEIVADMDGTVTVVHVEADQQIALGELVIEIGQPDGGAGPAR